MNRISRSLSSLALALALGTFSVSARADVAGSRCDSDRGSHVDVLTSKYTSSCYGHVERDEKGRFVRTVTLPEPMSGDVRSSRDLKSVVYIASYMSLLAHEALAQNPVVVRVYREGALVKEHRLLDVASKADLEQSISHVRFTSSIGSIDAKSELTLVTNGGTKIVLDTLTGERVPSH
jgi:hypothetical protein